MVFSVGEDLFSVLIAVGLVAVFVTALAHSYHLYAERRNASEDFDLALDIAEQLRNQVPVGENGQLGLLELSHERLENYSQILAVQGINFRVEVGTFVFAENLESANACELSVEVWRN
jgi:hypothetical protein